ncbi:hypothetical protein KAX97_14285, partial [candidate division WOR-3 bacterium]|nr:hypothetical protein [candidate division WOR-3 bacterium]
AGVGLFVMSAEVREILIALAALVAVIIAAFSINESRRIRQDSIERESRDRKERLVNEVAEWLRELDGRIYPELGVSQSLAIDVLKASSEISPETWLRQHERDITFANVTTLFSCIKGAEYYQKLAATLDEKLSSLIEVVMNDLEQRMQIATKKMESPGVYGEEESQLIDELIENDDRPLEGLNLSEQAIITIRFGRNARAIRKSILNAIDKAIELKTSLIQVP